MALNPLFVTGWEHGVAAIISTGGGGLSSGISGTPTSDAAAKRSGSYGLLINPSAAAEAVIYNTATTGIRKSAVRFYVRWPSSLPGTDQDLFSWRNVTPAQMAWVGFRASDSRIIVQVASGTATAIGPNPVVADTWYCIDAQFDSSSTTAVIRGRVDGGTENSANKTSYTAADIRGWHVAGTYTSTYTAYFDDLIFGTYTVDSEYWGAGAVVGIVPTADGTNAPSTVVENNAGTDLGVGTTPTAYDLLDEIPISSTANYVQQSGSGTGNYAEVSFGNLPGDAATVNGARAVLMYGASGTTGNTGGTIIRRGDGSPADVVLVGSTVTTTDINQKGATVATPRWDMSDTAPFYKGCMIPATADGTNYNALTVAIVNALLGRVGYSNDASPLPRWYSLMVEVDYAVATGTDYTQDLAGTVTSSSTKANLSVKSRGGTSTPHGAKANLSIKSRGGSSTSGGALRRATIKAFAGSAAPSGALEMATVKLVALAGTVTSVATLGKLAARAFTGAATSSATLKRASARHFAGTGASAGTAARKTIKAFAGSSSSTALLRRLGIKAFGGTITSSAEATNAEVAPNIYYLNLEGAIGYAAGWDDQNWDEPGFTWDLSGFSGELLFNQSLAQSLDGTITLGGALAHAITQAKAGTIVATATADGVEGKGFGGTITPASTVSKAVARKFVGSLSPAASFRRTVIKAFAGAVSPSASMSFGSVAVRAFAGTIAPAGGLTNVANNNPIRGLVEVEIEPQGRVEVELLPQGTASESLEREGMIA